MNHDSLSLAAASPSEGLALAQALALRLRQGALQAPSNLAEGLKAKPQVDPSLIVATLFQTVAAANNYWR